jgi:hypothetical protein
LMILWAGVESNDPLLPRPVVPPPEVSDLGRVDRQANRWGTTVLVLGTSDGAIQRPGFGHFGESLWKLSVDGVTNTITLWASSANMPKRPATTVDLVEATPERYVLDTRLGRVIIEPDSIRFHRNGRGRGVTLIERSD